LTARFTPSSGSIGFLLTISGSPYAFTSYDPARVAGYPDGDGDTAWSDAWELVWNLDVSRGFRWEEQCNPLEGELSVSQQSFTLHDVTAESGGAAGYPLVTWLTTRYSNTIARANLATSIDRDDLVVEVESDPGLGGGEQVLWIDGEAIFCDSFDSGSLEYTVNASGRGYYGSKATAHTVDTSRSYRPTVWTSFPWIRRRKAILWWWDLADPDRIARRLWTGVCGRSPRLGRNGAQMELQCDSLASVLRETPLGMSTGRCTTAGWNRNAIVLSAFVGDTGGTFAGVGGADANYEDTAALCPSFAEAAAQQSAALRAALNARSEYPYHADLIPEGQGARFTVEIDTIGSSEMAILASITGQDFVRANSTGSTNPQSASVVIEKVPRHLMLADPQNAYPIGVDNTEGLPASWTAASSGPNDGLTTTARVILRGSYSDNAWLEVHPTDVGMDAIPYITATAEFTAKKYTGFRTVTPQNFAITSATALSVTTHVYSPHWLHGLRYGVLADLADSLGDLLDEGDWDWTDFGRCVQLTPGLFHARDWYLDGETKLGAIVSDACRVSGFGQGIRGGKLTVFAFQPPVAGQHVAATITSADLVDIPTWSALPDGLANYVQFDGELLKATVAMQDSVSKYGPGRSIKATLRGVPAEAVAASNPAALLSTALSRMAGLWSEPTAAVTLHLSMQYLFETPLALGDYVTVSDWLAPNGTGGRGLTTRTVQIIGIAQDLAQGRVTITALDWYRPSLVGWSPACRVVSISGGVLTVAGPAVAYADGTDYAGSDQDGYRYTPNDGGVSWFAAGYKVRLRRWDTTTATELSAIVQSVNTATPSITLTTSPGATWEGYASTGIVDVVFGRYGDVTTAQKTVGGWVSSRTAGVIGGSSDPPNLWSP
jgi:hypothetical protein